jgi:N-dimethylarginine dimethylaminohydrolase
MDQLAAEFEITDSALTTMVFFDTRQKERETVVSFLRRLESTYCRCFPDETVGGQRFESDLRSQILRGLRPDAKQKYASALTERSYS